MPLSQTEYLWSGATPLLLISPARFFLYKGPKIDYFLRPPLDYRLLFALVSPMSPLFAEFCVIRTACISRIQVSRIVHIGKYRERPASGAVPEPGCC
jgi:hypothetical protein